THSPLALQPRRKSRGFGAGWGQLEPGLLLPYPCRGGQLSPWRQIPNLPSPGCMSPADFPLGNWGQVRSWPKIRLLQRWKVKGNIL
uniref:Uncharacterized protein n=1 Tax=Anas platyrhynchos platyrhynchos TaxID=8840 RepID=A0A493TCY4_ANAPP